MRRFVRDSDREFGFTLVELAVVVVLVGLLSGGGILAVNKWMQNRMRNEALAYMVEVEKALLAYARATGGMPRADTNGDGKQDTVSYGYVPYVDLGVKPFDPWGRQLYYEFNGALASFDKNVNCQKLRDAFKLYPVGGALTPLGFLGRPFVTERCPPASWDMTAAFVLVSPGARDADGTAGYFDTVVGCGSYTKYGPPSGGRFIRSPMTSKYDDLTRYVGEAEMYEAMQCGTASSPE